MSRQEQQDIRWLGAYRRLVAVILLLLIMAILVQHYRSYRAEVEGVTLGLLGDQFAARAQRLHGIWLVERRPARAYIEGVNWQFSEQGWPLGTLPTATPSESCRQLWQAMVGTATQDLPPLRFLARPDGSGCEIGWQEHGVIYQFADGKVMKR